MSDQTEASESSMPRGPAWFWEGRTVGIAIEDPPDRFLARLNGSTLAPGFDDQRLAGRKNTDGSVALTWNSRGRRGGRPSFQDEVFNGTVVPYREGSLIRGKFRIPVFTIVFSICWLAFTLPLAAYGLGAVLHGQTGGLIFTFWAGAFIVFHTLGRILALMREPRVVQLLEELGSGPAT